MKGSRGGGCRLVIVDFELSSYLRFMYLNLMLGLSILTFRILLVVLKPSVEF